jgi:hypothetical protein
MVSVDPNWLWSLVSSSQRKALDEMMAILAVIPPERRFTPS